VTCGTIIYAAASADWPDAHIGQQMSLASDCMPWVLVSYIPDSNSNSSLFKSCSQKAKKRYNAVHGQTILKIH